MIQKEFPKVLIITKNRINQIDGQSASLRNWFHDWPKKNLAQIYSYEGPETEKFCGYNYLFGGSDRRLGGLFDRLKYFGLGTGGRPAKTNFLIESGIWELIFTPRISVRLSKFVENFSPDIMYVQGWDISFMEIPLQLHKKFGILICVHIPDDWPEFLYQDTIFSPIIKFFLQRVLRRLFYSSAARFSTCELMSREYTQRYKIDFEPMMICDESHRFLQAKPNRAIDAAGLFVVYAGSLGAGRWVPILDLYNATQGLEINGKRINICVFSSSVSPDAKKSFSGKDRIHLLQIPSHDDLPSMLKGADLLFLPESFEKKYFSLLHLSISTKAHLYMMSERPILVYGPAYAGVVDYTKKYGWGYVVDKRDKKLLKEAVIDILEGRKAVLTMIEQGQRTIAANHEASVIRERFRTNLIKALSWGAQ